MYPFRYGTLVYDYCRLRFDTVDFSECIALSNFIWFLTSIWEQFCILSCEKQHRGSQELEQRVRSLQWFNRNFSCSHPVPRLTRSLSSPRAGAVNKYDSDKNKSLGMKRCSNASHKMEFLEHMLKIYKFDCAQLQQGVKFKLKHAWAQLSKYAWTVEKSH